MKYVINNRTIETTRSLTEAEIDSIAEDMQGVYGSANPDMPETGEQVTTDAPYPEMPQETMSFADTAIESIPAITGGLAGMAGMAVGGPVLAVPAAFSGGVAGEMAQNIIQGDAFDATNIFSEGLTQAAFEGGGTLVVNLAGKILRYTPAMLKAAGLSQGVDPVEAAKHMMKQAPAAGTPESRIATQQILQEGAKGPGLNQQTTATLSRGQTEQAGIIRSNRYFW